jgi:hypothetical protein
MKGWALLAVLVLAVFALAGCRSEPVPDIVGDWRHWESVLFVEFTRDGEVIYDIFPEARYREIKRGTYELLSEGSIFIDIAYQPSGEFSYEIQGDVMLLVDASGRRQVFNRVKESKE